MLYYRCTRHFYQYDDIVFEYGEACDGIFLILNGVISIELINRKKEITHQIDILGRGSIIGFNNVIGGTPWFYRARVCSEQTL